MKEDSYRPLPNGLYIGNSTIENGFNIENYVPTPLFDQNKRFILCIGY